MDKDRYIGATKVKDINETEKKSPLGKDLYFVTFEGDTDRPQYMTEELYNIVSTEEQEDENYVQKQKFDAILPEIVHLIGEYNLQFYQLGAMFAKAHEVMENRLERASSYVWTGNDNYHVQGYNFTNNISALDIREVLEAIERNNDKED